VEGDLGVWVLGTSDWPIEVLALLETDFGKHSTKSLHKGRIPACRQLTYCLGAKVGELTSLKRCRTHRIRVLRALRGAVLSHRGIARGGNSSFPRNCFQFRRRRSNSRGSCWKKRY
jgi:hypothetical protein